MQIEQQDAIFYAYINVILNESLLTLDSFVIIL